VDTVALAELLTILGIGVLTPGPNALTCFAHSGIYGPKSNIKLIFGMVLGFVLIELGVGLAIDTFKENTLALTISHYIGMMFLGLMAAAIFRVDPRSLQSESIEGVLGIKTGFFMQFANGKEWAFIIIIMSSFIEPLGGGFIGIGTIISITLAVCLTAMIAWTILGSRLDNIFSHETKGPLVFKICGSLLFLLWIALLARGPVLA
jgi:threonine/homoserine/homoserine lactone efflux protein